MSVESPVDASIERLIGQTIRSLRDLAGMSARELAVRSDVSAAMVSRIESGQVSASISSLSALSRALDVPLERLFRNTDTKRGDYTLARAGEGVQSRRVVDGHTHDFENLAVHVRRDLQFEARTVTLSRQSASPPRYLGQGVVFVQIVEGEALYQCGDDLLTLRKGDSVTLDAELQHGFVELKADTLVFLTVQAERRPTEGRA